MVAKTEIVNDRGLVEVCQIRHILNLVELWRIHLARLIDIHRLDLFQLHAHGEYQTHIRMHDIALTWRGAVKIPIVTTLILF